MQGQSTHELIALRKHVGHTFRATIYFYDAKLVIGAAQTGVPGGVYVELQDPLVEPEPASDEAIGFLAMQSLLGFESRPIPSLRDRKLTDWKAFRASGAKSVKAFESRTMGVTIETWGDSLRLESAPLVPNDYPYAVRTFSGASMRHAELGEQIRKLVSAARTLVDAGVA